MNAHRSAEPAQTPTSAGRSDCRRRLTKSLVKVAEETTPYANPSELRDRLAGLGRPAAFQPRSSAVRISIGK